MTRVTTFTQPEHVLAVGQQGPPACDNTEGHLRRRALRSSPILLGQSVRHSVEYAWHVLARFVWQAPATNHPSVPPHHPGQSISGSRYG